MASIAWAAVTYAMPEFEKKQRRTIVRTVATMSELPLSINIEGFSATLSGQVQDAESKKSIIEALGFHKGVFTVNDNLSIAEVKQVVETPNTAFDFDALMVNLAGNVQSSPAHTPQKLIDKRQALKQPSSNPDSLVDEESGGDENPTVVVEPSATATSNIADLPDASVSLEVQQQSETLVSDPEVETTLPLIKADDLSTVSLTETEKNPVDPISPFPGLPAKLEVQVGAKEVEETKTEIEKEAVTVTEAETETPDIQLAELAIPTLGTQSSTPSVPETTINERPNVLVEEILEQARSEVNTLQANAADEPAILESTKEALQQALSTLPTTQILFELGSAVLTPNSVNTLNQVAAVLISFPELTISIEGHTDATGESEANLALSLERAVVVRTYLIGQGVSMLNLRAKGYGEDKPLTSNETATGRATNRRIEFKF